MGSQTNYISVQKENELVQGTIQILKDAKQRKKNQKIGSVLPPQVPKSRHERNLLSRPPIKKKKVEAVVNKTTNQVEADGEKVEQLQERSRSFSYNNMEDNWKKKRAIFMDRRIFYQQKLRDSQKPSFRLTENKEGSPEKMIRSLSQKIKTMKNVEFNDLQGQNLTLGQELN